MNQQAIFRSIWEEGTVETDCEVTPSGEIINIDTVEPQFDAQHLESEEAELKTSGKVFQVSTNEEGDPVILEPHPHLRYQVLLVDGIYFLTGKEKVSYTGHGIYDGLAEAWVSCSETPDKPYLPAGGLPAAYDVVETSDLSGWPRANQATQLLCTERTEAFSRFDNHYNCPECQNKWSDTHSCMVDDQCGECGLKNISPEHSELICHIAEVTVFSIDIQRFIPYLGVAGGIPGIEDGCCVYTKMVNFGESGYAIALQLHNATDGAYCQASLYTKAGGSLLKKVATSAIDSAGSVNAITGEWQLIAPEGPSFLIAVSILEPKVIRLDAFGIEVTLTGDGGGSITSTVKEGHSQYDAVMDGIESMILAHAIAGIDVNSPSYLEGIETAVLGAANNTDDETLDDELSAKYIERGGCTCLICKDESIEGGIIQTNAGIAWQKVWCNSCGSEWTDNYKLVSTSDLSTNVPFRIGQEVQWTDPDADISSGVYTVKSIEAEDVVIITNQSGSELEVPVGELKSVVTEA